MHADNSAQMEDMFTEHALILRICFIERVRVTRRNIVPRKRETSVHNQPS